MSSAPEYDVIVIGAGHNGLTAAAYLAGAGLSTLVLERREVVGGCCITEEIAPGCRASTASYIASMLRPEVVRDLELASHGLRMVPCDPALQVAFPDGNVVPWWADRNRVVGELQKFSVRDARTFLRVDEQLKKLARYLQPFFLEPPPQFSGRGFEACWNLLQLGRRFRGIRGDEIAQLVSFLTGSLGEFLDRNYECERVKTLFLANNVYGKHGGPYDGGSALGLLFHLLSGGDDELQGFYGHVIGGMGSITQALAAAGRKRGVEIRTSAAVENIEVRDGCVRGVILENGTRLLARTVLSNADPKRTFLGLVDARELPEDFRHAVKGIKMNGPCAKVNFVLAEEPRVNGMPADASPAQRSLFTLVPSLEFAEGCYDIAKFGDIPEQLWVDCVVASNVDETLAPPGRHIMTCFVQYVPYFLRQGTWEEKRPLLGERVTKTIAEYAPNVPGAIIAQQVLTPLDLERTYGLTEGNIFHGDLTLEQLFFMRPVPGWSQYRTPIVGLYLCGAGAHPGGGVTGAPGHNAAFQVLRDLRRRRQEARA
ncbi:MAG: NAD(P)/FAD-dependent oxidoreductase [Acidobacteria bacterium]|nr:NAD(P)/FAD-dependent oxidoreductase [Acidobacteriota bacterium]MBV9483309.1 NAD(P)/FAD-dependent oxidoreductase [Acidobacteriota bacterium]